MLKCLLVLVLVGLSPRLLISGAARGSTTWWRCPSSSGLLRRVSFVIIFHLNLGADGVPIPVSFIEDFENSNTICGKKQTWTRKNVPKSKINASYGCRRKRKNKNNLKKIQLLELPHVF